MILASGDHLSGTSVEEEVAFDLVVKSTFLDLDDGQGLMKQYRKMRKNKTDFALEVAMKDPVLYELGEDFAVQKKPAKQIHESAARAEIGPDSDGNKHREGKGEDPKGRTTVMLRNLPNNYSRDMFLQMLDDNGFKRRYDFVYLPCDFYHDANLGYAFINLVNSEAVDCFWKAFQGFSDWSFPSTKVCQVAWSEPHQGFKAHVARYRNSPLMHPNVPDEFKPMLFSNGVRQPFPKPTKNLKAPFPF